jgi:hypothetical protein
VLSLGCEDVSYSEVFGHANKRVTKVALTEGRYVLSFFRGGFRVTLPAIAVLFCTVWCCLFIAHLHQFYISVSSFLSLLFRFLKKVNFPT